MKHATTKKIPINLKQLVGITASSTTGSMISQILVQFPEETTARYESCCLQKEKRGLVVSVLTWRTSWNRFSWLWQILTAERWSLAMKRQGCTYCSCRGWWSKLYCSDRLESSWTVTIFQLQYLANSPVLSKTTMKLSCLQLCTILTSSEPFNLDLVMFVTCQDCPICRERLLMSPSLKEETKMTLYWFREQMDMIFYYAGMAMMLTSLPRKQILFQCHWISRSSPSFILQFLCQILGKGSPFNPKKYSSLFIFPPSCLKATIFTFPPTSVVTLASSTISTSPINSAMVQRVSTSMTSFMLSRYLSWNKSEGCSNFSTRANCELGLLACVQFFLSLGVDRGGEGMLGQFLSQMALRMRSFYWQRKMSYSVLWIYSRSYAIPAVASARRANRQRCLNMGNYTKIIVLQWSEKESWSNSRVGFQLFMGSLGLSWCGWIWLLAMLYCLWMFDGASLEFEHVFGPTLPALQFETDAYKVMGGFDVIIGNIFVVVVILCQQVHPYLFGYFGSIQYVLFGIGDDLYLVMILIPQEFHQMPNLLDLHYPIPQYYLMLLLSLLCDLRKSIQSLHPVDTFYRGFYLNLDAIEVLLQLGELTEGSASLEWVEI